MDSMYYWGGMDSMYYWGGMDSSNNLGGMHSGVDNRGSVGNDGMGVLNVLGLVRSLDSSSAGEGHGGQDGENDLLDQGEEYGINIFVSL